VMVSYAAEGGGVGPHYDSYDVFLLQGMGRRRWQISGQKNRDLLEGAPLKILRDFRPEQEWLLDPGDMLYLPPGHAHDGVAVTECMTYSIGFRAPSAQELASAFLGHLQDHLALDGMYSDPDLAATVHPGEVSASMVRNATAILERTLWGRNEVEEFLGVYLSEPKPHVLFNPRNRTLSRSRFLEAVAAGGVRLALKSRLLYRRPVFYLNGERFRAPKSDVGWLVSLSDNRSAGGAEICAETSTQLYDWYTAGFIEPMGATASRSARKAQEDDA
jgi:50S ribosomal protein L16 3-hydroxylase